ncbi:MAG: hypothetical protein ACE5RL_08130 [Nitrosarchaeum sp.]
MNISEIIQNANRIGLKISNLDEMDEQTLEEMQQAVKDYKENRDFIAIDYMW